MQSHQKQRQTFEQADIHSMKFNDLLDLDDACNVVDGAKEFGLTKEEIVLQKKRNRA